MKLFLFLLFVIITIEDIHSKTLYRTYIVERGNLIKGNQLSNYVVYDSTGKNFLYRLKCTSADIDTIMVSEQPAKNMIANMEGEWVEKVFDVSLSIYDKKSGKWIDGAIKQESTMFRRKFRVEWNFKHLNVEYKLFTGTMQVFSQKPREVVAEVRPRSPWFGIGKMKFELKVFSSQYPDAIYFFLLAISDHRTQISDSKR